MKNMEGAEISKLQDRHQKETVPNTKVMKDFPGKKSGKNTIAIVVSCLIVILGGILSGKLLSKQSLGSIGETPKTEKEEKLPEGEEGISVEQISDKVKDAEGVLVEGGIKGEGTYHLERSGGDSQNVYLTSTTIDLTPYVGKKIQVWGETLSGVYAGWLMDVVKVKELE